MAAVAIAAFFFGGTNVPFFMGDFLGVDGADEPEELAAVEIRLTMRRRRGVLGEAKKKGKKKAKKVKKKVKKVPGSAGFLTESRPG